MIVQITKYEFKRKRYGDWNGDVGSKSPPFLSLMYYFITLTNNKRETGYHGYFESPSFYIQICHYGNSFHERLPAGLAELWFILFKPEPYFVEKRDAQDYGEDSFEPYYTEKYFYKPRFKAYDVVNIEFDTLFIKHPLKPADLDITNDKVFLICPLRVHNITLVEDEIGTELSNDLPF